MDLTNEQWHWIAEYIPKPNLESQAGRRRTPEQSESV